MTYKAVIFDLDGTLVDSIYVWKKVDIDFFKKRGMEVPKDYTQKINAMSFEEAAIFTKKEYGFPESVEDIKNEWFAMALFEYGHNVKLKDNAKNYIKKLKQNGIKIGLATASPSELYEATLKSNGVFDCFDAFTSGSEVQRSKAYPDIYLKTAQKLKVEPKDCLVFEDIAKAVSGAKKADMTVIGVFDEYSKAEKDKIIQMADGYIYNFNEMIEI